MSLPFLDRAREIQRLRRAFSTNASTLVCLYGRRRVGKSRLLRESLYGAPGVYFVGEDRSAPLQRSELAQEIETLCPGFAAVVYPEWGALLARFRRDAPPGAVLALDEFPSLVASAPELPSVLQRSLDETHSPPLRVAVCGSSQSMMQGLVLDAAAPLYGRASEILRLAPLPARWIIPALGLPDARAGVEHYAAWGGIPRYWELAGRFPSREDAVADLVLDPAGVLHHEPDRLLRDDFRETTQAATLLALVGMGCHRSSELAGRMALPATSLSRPLARLVELGLLRRDAPFGHSARDTKRSLYRVGDPFLRWWYRIVGPARSRLEAGQLEGVARAMELPWRAHLAETWEDLCRERVGRAPLLGRSWLPAGRWWDRERELDVVSTDAEHPLDALVGEVKLRLGPDEVDRTLADLERRARGCPDLVGKKLHLVLFVLDGTPEGSDPRVIGPSEVLG